MAGTLRISPFTRIEGHLDIEVTIARFNGTLRVVDAKSEGTLFRGFEQILQGRDPRDASHYTQRICGVCPVSHGMAASKNLESAFGVLPPDNGRILRNFVLGANFLQSHILHFYHLTALDYIDTTGILDLSPWKPRFVTPDMVGGATAASLVEHYVAALAIRRKAHQLGAIYGGKLPMAPSLVPGGCSEEITKSSIEACRALLTEIRGFVTDVHLPDLDAVAGAFPEYASIGRGSGNLLAYGVFDLDAAGIGKLLKRGVYTDGEYRDLDVTAIDEDVKYSWYGGASAASASTSRTRLVGASSRSSRKLSAVKARRMTLSAYKATSGGSTSATVASPQPDKAGAYSWVKAPRYDDTVCEVGPLARMWVNGDYREGISVIDRLMARAVETQVVAEAMDEWLDQLRPGQPTYVPHDLPRAASGMGLTEAPRGALGHWLEIDGSKIARYNVIT
ncbi:MAG: nickel-dependent hydrogenase large subunit, partial [Candidatus Brocadiae bacterium]|nr:nickel-dependent hydrogenase large subunit [Candidatus Brocadiia bacterium]